MSTNSYILIASSWDFVLPLIIYLQNFTFSSVGEANHSRDNRPSQCLTAAVLFRNVSQPPHSPEESGSHTRSPTALFPGLVRDPDVGYRHVPQHLSDENSPCISGNVSTVTLPLECFSCLIWRNVLSDLIRKTRFEEALRLLLKYVCIFVLIHCSLFWL